MRNAPEAPQSCYPEEIETLREMLAQEEYLLSGFRDESASGFERGKRRVEALRTAIEALAGAL
jgi:hypothetical protein